MRRISQHRRHQCRRQVDPASSRAQPAEDSVPLSNRRRSQPRRPARLPRGMETRGTIQPVQPSRPWQRCWRAKTRLPGTLNAQPGRNRKDLVLGRQAQHRALEGYPGRQSPVPVRIPQGPASGRRPLATRPQQAFSRLHACCRRLSQPRRSARRHTVEVVSRCPDTRD